MAKRGGGVAGRHKGSSRDQGQLRIIGGRWRGRKLSFQAAPGLRPTTDRVRETLFNWLAPWLPEARCLDLFSGSGALGLEALSRGAASCQFVDLAAASCRQIDEHLRLLQADDCGITHCGGAEQYLEHWQGDPFDLVFIDPPFGLGLAEPALIALHSRSLLAPGALVYLECGDDENFPHLPPDWQIIRDKRAGAVRYTLLTTEPTND
jgi:16S rRNA (guanine966-N2)-methyltransferase